MPASAGAGHVAAAVSPRQTADEEDEPPLTLGERAHRGSAWLVVLAGLAFLLPFVGVSCSGSHAAGATGVQAVTGADLTPSFGDQASNTQAFDAAQRQGLRLGPFAPVPGSGRIHLDEQPLAALAAVLTAAALLVRAVPGWRRHALVAMAASAAAVALLALHMRVAGAVERDLQALINEQTGGAGGDPGAVVTLDWGPGYWITLAGLGGAAVLEAALLTGETVRAVRAAPPSPPLRG